MTIDPAKVDWTDGQKVRASHMNTLGGKVNEVIDALGAGLRVGSTASSATPSIDSDAYDAYSITALNAAITSVSITGTPDNFQRLLIRIKDNGTARALAWGSSVQAGSVALPTTTVLGKTLLVGLMYDSVDAKWSCEASGSRA